LPALTRLSQLDHDFGIFALGAGRDFRTDPRKLPHRRRAGKIWRTSDTQPSICSRAPNQAPVRRPPQTRGLQHRLSSLIGKSPQSTGFAAPFGNSGPSEPKSCRSTLPIEPPFHGATPPGPRLNQKSACLARAMHRGQIRRRYHQSVSDGRFVADSRRRHNSP
jgi:hypothetical protein